MRNVRIASILSVLLAVCSTAWAQGHCQGGQTGQGAHKPPSTGHAMPPVMKTMGGAPTGAGDKSPTKTGRPSGTSDSGDCSCCNGKTGTGSKPGGDTGG